MIKISIIVPVYNVEKFVEECIESLVEQTLDEIEILLIDDCSTDGSKNIIEKYQKKYSSKITLLEMKQNSKQGAARNVGLKKAAGKYVMFVDSDDILDRNACERMYYEAEKQNADIVFCDYVSFQSQTREEYYQQHVYKEYMGELTKRKKEILLTTSVVPWAKIIRRELIISYDIFFTENIFFEDQATTYLYYLFAKKVVKVEEALYKYRLHSQSTTGAVIDDNKLVQRIKSAEIFVNRIKENGLYEEYKTAVDYFIIEQMYCLSIDIYMRNHCVEQHINVDFVLEKLHQLCPKYRENKYYKYFLTEKNRKIIEAHEKSEQYLKEIYCEKIIEQYCNNYTSQLIWHRPAIKELKKMIDRNGYKTVLWGAGKSAINIIEVCNKEGIVFDYLTDSNIQLLGKTVAGFKVTDISKIKDEIDLIVIEFSAHKHDIDKLLKKYDIHRKILVLEEYIKNREL